MNAAERNSVGSTKSEDLFLMYGGLCPRSTMSCNGSFSCCMSFLMVDVSDACLKSEIEAAASKFKGSKVKPESGMTHPNSPILAGTST
jgi:hypothetical protein